MTESFAVNVIVYTLDRLRIAISRWSWRGSCRKIQKRLQAETELKPSAPKDRESTKAFRKRERSVAPSATTASRFFQPVVYSTIDQIFHRCTSIKRIHERMGCQMKQWRQSSVLRSADYRFSQGKNIGPHKKFCFRTIVDRKTPLTIAMLVRRICSVFVAPTVEEMFNFVKTGLVTKCRKPFRSNTLLHTCNCNRQALVESCPLRSF
jgi:hypothetical protein